jgi:1,6-anhydro-N-acetylmuramate kinase
MSAATFVELARELGLIHVDTIKLLLGSSERADLIAVHGQTIYHAPPMSWQLIDPGPVAAAFECPVVYDLRAADLEAGGQGAPITPLADWIMFRHPERSRAIVNLGGFCNVTILPAGTSDDAIGGIRGFDVCVCNQLLDMVAREKLGQAYDDRGLAAAVGRTDRQSGVELYDLLARQRSAGRSLGTGDEAIAWVHAHKYRVDGHDLASTATEAVACCIAEVLAPHEPDDIIVAGGGSLNQTLTGGIGEFAGARTRLSGDLGVPIDSREAMAIAILGAMCEDGVPITLPAVTGCRLPAPVAGRWVGRTQRESPAASGSDPSRTSA